MKASMIQKPFNLNFNLPNYLNDLASSSSKMLFKKEPHLEKTRSMSIGELSTNSNCYEKRYLNQINDYQKNISAFSDSSSYFNKNEIIRADVKQQKSGATDELANWDGLLKHDTFVNNTSKDMMLNEISTQLYDKTRGNKKRKNESKIRACYSLAAANYNYCLCVFLIVILLALSVFNLVQYFLIKAEMHELQAKTTKIYLLCKKLNELDDNSALLSPQSGKINTIDFGVTGVGFFAFA